ncbi:GNAT family N-acetyltransferase [Ideonella sp.]|uniref:GNAT family N-acetyltransferase n=1 Tax=Ideonella sp. TaxID=1929293 RepID=UPI003BB6C045
MRIAPAQQQHAEGLATLHVQAWQAAYAGILSPGFLAGLSVEARAERWQAVLQAAESSTWVARLTDETSEPGPGAASDLAGFVSFAHCRDAGAPADQGEIWALYAAPAAWGKGVGRALLRRAVDELMARGFRSVSLWVFSDNWRARRFYERCGFQRVVGSEKRFELGGREVEEVALWAPVSALSCR